MNHKTAYGIIGGLAGTIFFLGIGTLDGCRRKWTEPYRMEILERNVREAAKREFLQQSSLTIPIGEEHSVEIELDVQSGGDCRGKVRLTNLNGIAEIETPDGRARPPSGAGPHAAVRAPAKSPNTAPEPPKPKHQVYEVGAGNMVSPYFADSESKLDYLLNLLDSPTGIPYANYRWMENNILITGRVRKSNEDPFCRNFRHGDAILDGRIRRLRMALTPQERERLLRMIGGDPGADGPHIYNRREISTQGSDILVSELYRIGLHGLSESEIGALDENICRGQHNVLTIDPWWEGGYDTEGDPPVRSWNADTFVYVRADSRFVGFSSRDYAAISDERPGRDRDSSITFRDDSSRIRAPSGIITAYPVTPGY